MLEPYTSTNFQAEWQWHFKASRYLLGFIALSHSLALVWLWWLPLTLGLQLMLSALVVGLGIRQWCRYAGYLNSSVATLTWREFGGWEATTQDGQHYALILANSSVCQPWLSVLNLHSRARFSWQRRYITVVLLPDNLSAQQGQLLRRRWYLLT